MNRNYWGKVMQKRQQEDECLMDRIDLVSIIIQIIQIYELAADCINPMS